MSARTVVSVLSIVLAMLVVLSVVLGPLLTGTIVQRASTNAVDQFRGSEFISLLIVVPILVLASVFFHRAHPIAPYLSMAAALFCIYTYITVIIGQDYRSTSGNVERAFPLYAAMVALGTTISVIGWREIRETAAIAAPHQTRMGLGSGLIAMSCIVALMWAAQLSQIYRGNPDSAYTDSPALFWSIKLLDFGFVIPGAFIIAEGLMRNRPYAFEAGTVFLGFFTLLTVAIAAMGVSPMLAEGSSAQVPMVAVLALIVIGLACVDAQLLARIASG